MATRLATRLATCPLRAITITVLGLQSVHHRLHNLSRRRQGISIAVGASEFVALLVYLTQEGLDTACPVLYYLD
ncbi:uncharacterized protein BDV17DRAFT_296670 [Aspergillus undulatus]|uniref:uncharacterized protein n=1 Tax=Aspergillus undulatus TaxID=1810928 RepID=UPI003CCD686E